MTDGWTDRHLTKLVVAYWNFANARKNESEYRLCRSQDLNRVPAEYMSEVRVRLLGILFGRD